MSDEQRTARRALIERLKSEAPAPLKEFIEWSIGRPNRWGHYRGERTPYRVCESIAAQVERDRRQPGHPDAERVYLWSVVCDRIIDATRAYGLGCSGEPSEVTVAWRALARLADRLCAPIDALAASTTATW